MYMLMELYAMGDRSVCTYIHLRWCLAVFLCSIYCLAWVGGKLLFLLPQPLKCLDYRHQSPSWTEA